MSANKRTRTVSAIRQGLCPWEHNGKWLLITTTKGEQVARLALPIGIDYAADIIEKIKKAYGTISFEVIDDIGEPLMASEQ